MFAALLSAICTASGDVFNKILLGRRKMPLSQYLPAIFIFLALLCGVASVFFFKFDLQLALSVKFILLLLIMIASATIWNILLARGLQKEPLHEYELIILFAPLATMLLASIVYPVERNIHILLAGLFSSLILICSRIRKHHFALSKGARGTLLAIIFIAIEAVVIKELLLAYSPVFLNFIRVSALALTFLIIYKPKPQVEALTNFPLLLLASIAGSCVMIFKFIAFSRIGVVETTLILLLGPVLTYLASYFYFEEKKNFKRDALTAAVVIGMIVYVTIK